MFIMPRVNVVMVNLLMTAHIVALPCVYAANDTLEMTATITKGTCSLSVSPSVVTFLPPHIVSEFHPGNAVAVAPLALNYDCTGFSAGTLPSVKLTGETATGDANVFLSAPQSQSAAGSGFMLKHGEVTQLEGFYTAGTTWVANGTYALSSNAQGSEYLTVGFVKQNSAVPVTVGDVNATLTFTYITP